MRLLGWQPASSLTSNLLPLTEDLRPASEPSRLTDRQYPVVTGVVWTADSREVLYAAGSNRLASLWRVRALPETTPQRLLFAAPDVHSLSISHKASRLVYASRIFSRNLWSLDRRTGQRKMIGPSTYDSAFPQYSPDGSRVAFQSNRTGNLEVWTCQVDGSDCVQVTFFGGPQCGTPRWSPDGRSIALDARLDGSSAIYVTAADGHGTPRRVTSKAAGFNDLQPSWSPDSLFISRRTGVAARRSGGWPRVWWAGDTIDAIRRPLCAEFAGWPVDSTTETLGSFACRLREAKRRRWRKTCATLAMA